MLVRHRYRKLPECTVAYGTAAGRRSERRLQLVNGMVEEVQIAGSAAESEAKTKVHRREPGAPGASRYYTGRLTDSKYLRN